MKKLLLRSLNDLQPAAFLFTILFSLFFSLVSYAQQIEYCGTDALANAILQQLSPDISQNERLQNFSRSSETPSSYTIPAVVHVIHDNGPENISDAQIMDAIGLVNDQLLDQSGGVNLKIKLELATIDPWGSCSDGIVRVQTPQS